VVTEDTITAERLDLPSLSADQLQALLEGRVAVVEQSIGAAIPHEWLEYNHGLMKLRMRQIREDPRAQRWLLRPIVLRRGEHPVIGSINFHGPPDARGMVEVGYGLSPEYRGRGYAIEAVRALFAWAELDPSVRVFRASVAPDNERSLHLIGKLGFVQVGEQIDPEDGLELVFERPARTAWDIGPEGA
jgi:ribosomal-protein-alanine N-acetyltransferase